MNVQFRDHPEPARSAQVKTAIADCDIHPARATASELHPFMARRSIKRARGSGTCGGPGRGLLRRESPVDIGRRPHHGRARMARCLLLGRR